MLNKRERRIGIVAAVVLGALALDRTILSPLLARRSDAQMRIEAAQAKLIDATGVFDNDRRAQRLWKELAGNSLTGSAPDAEGQLLNRTRAWADTGRLSLQSLKPERSESESGYQKITIRATATGTLKQVAQFLYAVQTADMPVRVSDLQVSARKDNTDDLSVVIALSTIYLPPGAPRPEARR